MPDIVALIQCFAPSVTATTLRQMGVILPAMIKTSPKSPNYKIRREIGLEQL